MPPTLFGLISRVSGKDQVYLSILSILLFLADTAPIEIQRRIINAAVKGGSVRLVIVLACVFAGLALAQGLLKFGVNVYRSWVGESAVRWLRNEISALARSSSSHLPSEKAGGVEIAMIVAEADPIGSFVGSSFSEPLLQTGVLLTVFSYLVYLQPLMALVGILVFLPQCILVPLMQGAINRRVEARIWILRKISVALVDTVERSDATSTAQSSRVEKVFQLNMGIYQFKFALNFVMNFLSMVGTAVILGLGGYFVIAGYTEIGTVVAFVSGLAKISAPWGDLVNWFRDYRVTHARYHLVANALRTSSKRSDVPRHVSHHQI